MKLHLIFTVIFIILIAIEFAFRKPLFDASLTIIKNLQNAKTDAGVLIFDYISRLGAGVLYFGIFALVFNWYSRAVSFYHLLFLISCLFLMNETKMIYHEPRPYFVDDEIDSLDKCSAEYGNPSGHSLFASAFFSFLYFEIW